MPQDPYGSLAWIRKSDDIYPPISSLCRSKFCTNNQHSCSQLVMAVDLRALFAAKRKKWARDNVCQVIFHKLQSLMFARNAIAYLLAKANLGPTSVTIQTLDFSWSKFERFTSSVLQGGSKLLIVFHTNQLILLASWMCVKQIAHTYRYCCGSVLHQSFILTTNQFHGCGSSLNHVYFNKEVVLQL